MVINLLISTSRKPSQKTRIFCKNLAHTFGFEYTNRGKSSLRDLLVKAVQLNEEGLLLVYQIKGNPSKITFYNKKGEEQLALLISVNVTNDRLNMIPEKLKIKSNVEELNILADLLGFELAEGLIDSNYIRISYADYDDEKNFAIIYFVNQFGEQLDLQINVKKIAEINKS